MIYTVLQLLFCNKYFTIEKTSVFIRSDVMKKKKYFVDFIDIDFFKGNIFNFEYSYSFSDNKENYSVSFIKNNIPFIDLEYSASKPPHYYWLSFFDYNRYPKEILFKAKLETFYEDCFAILAAKDKFSSIEIIIERYKEYINFHPYFLSYFELFYELLHLHLSNKYDFDYEPLISKAKTNLDNITTTYAMMKDFIYWSLIFHNEIGEVISPKKSVRMLEFYLNETNKDNIFLKYLFKNTIGFLQSDLCSTQADFMKSCLEDLSVSVSWEINGDISYDHEFSDTLNYIIDNDQILSKCPNCERYFLKKYTSTATYCTNLFLDTKANCQEYAARTKYQSKLYSNPIQAEYYLVRKRKAIKVKRGSLSESEAKLDDLYLLRDKYLELYNSCLEQEREEITAQFKEAINFLYGEPKSTHGE